MCFGGGSDSSDKMLKMQEQEAKDARAKAEALTARLNSGVEQIRRLFRGAPVMGSRQVATPAGVRYEDVPAREVWKTVNDPRTGVNRRVREIIPGHRRAINVAGGTATEQYDTGQRSGGFGQDFYDDFKKSITDYYMPQVARQHGEATSKLTKDLARAGQVNSSTAIDKSADLTRQKMEHDTTVKNQAETMAGQQATRIAQEEQNAINQLYATNDPEVAVTNATNAIRNISPAATDLTPLSLAFDIGSIGAAKFGAGYQNAQELANIRKMTGGIQRNQRTVGTA